MGEIIKKKGSIISEAASVRSAIEEGFSQDISFLTRKIEVDETVSTGSTLVDLAISGKRKRGGGIPKGVLVEIYGRSQSGKTALMAEILASAQANNGSTQIEDPEGRLDREYSRIFGVTINKENYSRPDTVEQIFENARNWEPPDPNVLNVRATDSLAALTTELEVEKGDKMGMKRAKEFSGGFRTTARLITNNKWIWVCTNQTRQGTYGDTTPGGKAVSFYASIRLEMKQVELITKEVKLDSGKSLKKIIGIQSECFVEKTIDDPFRSAPVYIIFNYGIDDIRANLQYIKDMEKLTTYHCPDGKTLQQLNMAVTHVEKEKLVAVLREEVIDLWETIEKKFETVRPKKERF